MPKFVAEKLKEVASHPERTDMHQYTRCEGLGGRNKEH